MIRGGLLPVAIGVAAIAALLSAPVASAATLTGDYQMQGTAASAGPGPPLTGLGAASSFQSDTVMGVQRQVLSFPKDSGLQMTPAALGNGSGPYSAVVTFRFDQVDGYRLILDPTNLTYDTGLYAHNARLNIYDSLLDPYAFDSVSALLAPFTYATVAMVQRPPSGVDAYFNGTPAVHVAGAAANVVSDTLRFFQDDSGGKAEESAGAVSCIRVYSGALTDAEVAAVGASPTCAAPAAVPSATPVPSAKKKCKKKKKHRAAEAKKKCKKKKKK